MDDSQQTIAPDATNSTVVPDSNRPQTPQIQSQTAQLNADPVIVPLAQPLPVSESESNLKPSPTSAINTPPPSFIAQPPVLTIEPSGPISEPVPAEPVTIPGENFSETSTLLSPEQPQISMPEPVISNTVAPLSANMPVPSLPSEAPLTEHVNKVQPTAQQYSQTFAVDRNSFVGMMDLDPRAAQIEQAAEQSGNPKVVLTQTESQADKEFAAQLREMGIPEDALLEALKAKQQDRPELAPSTQLANEPQ